jgi:hydroxymethylbilane synthase
VSQKIIKIATRRSELALKQAQIAISTLQPIFGDGFRFEILKIVTTGDKIQDRSLQDIGGKALFTKEIEDALLDGSADIAVHSMKDVTAVFPAALTFPAFFPRANPQDAIVSNVSNIMHLPHGAIIGTSSSRRSLFLKALREDFNIIPLRGNVPTRITALREGHVDAIVLAAAGLERLGIDKALYHSLPVDSFIPAACQGVIGLQTRVNWQYNYLVEQSSHLETTITTECERAFLQCFNADCKTPIAAYARIQAKELYFTGMYSNLLGNTTIKSGSTNLDDGEALAIKIANEIKRCIL